jgi:hypothetical protein
MSPYIPSLTFQPLTSPSQTPGGQTLDSFIQLGLDFPTCPVGLIAGDEYTYETYDEIIREVRPRRIRDCYLHWTFIEIKHLPAYATH